MGRLLPSHPLGLLDFDPGRLVVGILGNGELKQPMLEAGFGLLRIDPNGKLDGPLERAMVQFATVIRSGFLCLLLLDLGMERQGLLMQRDGQIVLVDPREFGTDTQFLVPIDHINTGGTKDETRRDIGREITSGSNQTIFELLEPVFDRLKRAEWNGGYG